MALNVEYLEKMPLAQKALILLVVILLVGALWYYMLYDPKKAQLASAEAAYQTKLTDMNRLRKMQDDEKNLLKNIEDKRRTVEKYKEILPTQTEMDQLLLQIDEIGKKNGLFFENFRPKKESPKGGLYIEVPIDLDFNGGYKYVMNFFFEVVNMKRIVKFSDLKITLAKKGGAGHVKVKCLASTYKFLAVKPKPAEEGKPGAAPGAAPARRGGGHEG